MSIKKLYFVVMLILLSWLSAFAQKSDYEIQHTTKEIRIDGLLNDKLWHSVVPVHPVQVGAKARDSLTNSPKYYILQSNESIIVGGLVPLNYHNHSDYLNEIIPLNATQIEVILKNPRNPHYAFGFKLTPQGYKSDVSYNSLDANSPYHEANVYWNTQWKVASKFQDSIWTFEIRIPYRFLNLDTSSNPNIEMAIWLQNRDSEEISVWPFIEPSVANWYEKGARGLRLALLTPIKIMSLQGKISGITYNHFQNNQDKLQYSLGASGHFHFNDKHQVSALINPDFTDARPLPFYINLGQFRYYQQDTRSQVYDNESIFSFDWNENNTLILPAQIYGDSLGYQFGRMDYVGNTRNFTLGSRHYFLPNKWINHNRIKLHWNDNLSQLGLVNINVNSETKTRLYLGIDYTHIFDDNLIIELKHVTDFTRKGNISNNLWNRSRFSIIIEKQKLLGLNYSMGLNHYGDSYDNRLSFEDLENYDALHAHLSYAWKKPISSLFYIQSFTLQNKTYLQDNNLTSYVNTSFIYKAESKRGAQIGMAYEYLNERILDTKDFFSDITIYKGVYGQSRLQLMAKSPLIAQTYYAIDWKFGEWYDGEFSLLDHSLGFHMGSRIFTRIHHLYLIHIRPSYPFTPLIHKHIINYDFAYALSKSFDITVQMQSSNLKDLLLGYCTIDYRWKDKIQFSLIYRNKISFDHINPNWMVDQSANNHYGAIKASLFLNESW